MKHIISFVFIALLVLASLLTGCAPNESYIVLVTATPSGNPAIANLQNPGNGEGVQPDEIATVTLNPNSVPTPTFVPTPEATRSGIVDPAQEITYIVQPGDTLAVIANSFGVTVETLVDENGLPSADVLSVGQLLIIPQSIQYEGPDFKIIPDSELIYGPGVRGFSVTAAMQALPNSFLANYTEEFNGQMWSGADLVEQVALEQSINPRLLLALLEYESRWLSKSHIEGDALMYPMGYVDEPNRVVGLYEQLNWAGKMLQMGYYGWRIRGLAATVLADGARSSLDPTLNAGTAGVQVLLGRTRTYDEWVVATGHTGLFATYVNMFGDPFLYATDPVIPANLTQPELSLPWNEDEEWYYTGGPHGGWGSGSPWAALDFVSREETIGCEVDSAYVRAMADGVIAVNRYGIVILDLDGDGDPGTGWTVYYLHTTSATRMVTEGQVVQRGDPIGNPACEGGFSTATHVHIARRYNGEWIAADCTNCISEIDYPGFVMSGWTVYSFGYEYDGSLIKGDEYREACACRADFNRMSGW